MRYCFYKIFRNYHTNRWKKVDWPKLALRNNYLERNTYLSETCIIICRYNSYPINFRQLRNILSLNCVKYMKKNIKNLTELENKQLLHTKVRLLETSEYIKYTQINIMFFTGEELVFRRKYSPDWTSWTVCSMMTVYLRKKKSAESSQSTMRFGSDKQARAKA